MSDALEGQTLGRYRILEALGRGGMAHVYRAYHPQLDRYVAVKVLRSDLVDDPSFLARFRREAQAVAALRHPHLVQVFDFDCENDRYYMVMELLAGDTLKACLERHKAQGERMPLGEIVRILLDVLDGLAYAHSEGVIHRDLKPGNILLTEQGEAVIGDFGVAQIIGGSCHTVSGVMLGTMSYMAPERGLKGTCDARSDIYSLGVVLYEMLTQRPPFEADTPLAVLMKHVHDPLPLPRQIDPQIPVAFERVVLKALAKDPEDRYQSARVMAQSLRDVVDGLRIDVPDRLSTLLDSTEAKRVGEPIAVFSGPGRLQIPDGEFATGDTEGLVEEGGDGDVLLGILAGVGTVLLGNLMMLAVASVTNSWGIYGQGWPIEIFLVALGLCFVQFTTASIWLSIPTGPMAVAGILMAYSAMTGRWGDWRCLWPPLAWTILLFVAGPIWFHRRLDRLESISRVLAVGVGVICAIGMLLLMGMFLLPSVFSVG